MKTTLEPIQWQDFAKIDMRVGTIKKAEVFKKAKNPAYILTIDFGEYGILKSSAQITQRYTISDLEHQQIIAVVNFPKKQIANIQSACLVLGVVGDPLGVVLLHPTHPIENGLKIG